jgi:hypothetical protein
MYLPPSFYASRPEQDMARQLHRRGN